MNSLGILNAAEQVARYLRGELRQGRWTGLMPGINQLTKELGVNHKTIESAVILLEKEGILVGQGPRRRKKIEMSEEGFKRSLRIGILLFEGDDRKLDYIIEIFFGLNAAGHNPFFLSASLSELGMDVNRVASLVEKTNADAWLVLAGSREVLSWFANQKAPIFALFGRSENSAIAGAGPSKGEAYREAVRKLIACGHKRIVLLARPQRKIPQPGVPEQAFLSALEDGGIEVADYHFPFWKNSKEDFYKCLDSLFKMTPPTALIVQEFILWGAVEQFLGTHGVRVPDDLSLICADSDSSFAWRNPSIAYFRIGNTSWIGHALRWAVKISLGEDYRRQIRSKVQYVHGGTVGPAPGFH
ncbi:MAG: DNA-binding LacI/PurR family transcriptional regulator [Akkermansiaceae bacterium]|jgi:DNA-binding LacI/PurR family transcriptional regulator